MQAILTGACVLFVCSNLVTLFCLVRLSNEYEALYRLTGDYTRGRIRRSTLIATFDKFKKGGARWNGCRLRQRQRMASIWFRRIKARY